MNRHARTPRRSGAGSARLERRPSPRLAPLSLVAALLLAPPVAGAQSADLMTALQAAQATDPTIRAARSTLELAQLKWPEARAALMPTVNLSGNLNTVSASTAFTGVSPIARNGDSHSLTLQLVQPLFRIDGVLANNQAPLVIENAQAQFDQARQDLLLRLAGAYFAINEATDALAEADAQVAAMERQLLEVTKGYEAGTRAVTDVDDTKARLGAAHAQQIAARGELQNTHADLERLTGVRYARLSALPEGISLPSPQPAQAQDWIDQARDGNPQVRAMRAAVEVARIDVSRAQAGHSPTVDLVMSVSRNYSNHSLTTPEDYSTKASQKEIGVQVNVPLFAGGAIVTRVNQAEVALEKARADLEAAQRDSATAAERAFNGVLANLAQVEALETSVRASENALKGNLVGFRVGYKTNVDVLNAEQQLYGARSSRSKARYEALLQGLKLKAAAGILGEQDLQGLAALMK